MAERRKSKADRLVRQLRRFEHSARAEAAVGRRPERRPQPAETAQ